MLWLRVTLFSVMVPGFVCIWLPAWIRQRWPDSWSVLEPLPTMGWPLTAAGCALYVWAALEFCMRGKGTPAIFFSRPLKFLLGEEPARLVSGSIYRFSRNPMYLGVVLAIFGQAISFASPPVLVYALLAWLFFHCVVVWLEEPHLRSKDDASYRAYCRSVPRWFPLRRKLPA